jgi:TPR repeat protein
MLPMAVVITFSASTARSDPPSGIEAEQYRQACQLASQGRFGEAEKILRGMTAPIAKARLALFISEDDVDLRLLGIRSFDPNLAAKLVKEALPSLRHDAERHAQSARILGSLYRYGLGVRSDPNAAFRLYTWAASRGDEGAMSMLAICYFEGKGVAKDSRRAMDWLKRASDRGDLFCMVALAQQYESGDAIPKNPTLAIQLYEKAAMAGSIDGMRECARLAHDRRHRAFEKRDLRAALSYGAIANNWLRKAASAGDANSMKELADYMRIGLPPPDPKELFHLYKDAADSGVSYTLLYLGACYLDGTGTSEDREKANDLFRRAGVAAKREGNDAVEAIVRSVLAEKTEEGRIGVIRDKLGWSANSFAPGDPQSKGESFIVSGDPKPALGRPSQVSRPKRKAIRGGATSMSPLIPSNVELVLTDTVVNQSATGSYVYVEGRFRNVSSHMLNFLRISVTFEDSLGKLVTTEQTFSEPSNVPPGITGTFKASAPSNPRFAGVKLSFSSGNKPVEWRDGTGKGVHQ